MLGSKSFWNWKKCCGKSYNCGINDKTVLLKSTQSAKDFITGSDMVLISGGVGGGGGEGGGSSVV